MKRVIIAIWFSALPLTALVAACGDDDPASDSDAGEQPLTCEPACELGACMVCDTDGTVPVCVTTCGNDTTCESGLCVAVEEATCDPVCGDCEMCDTSADSPVCVGVCADDMACVGGVCQSAACSPACGACEVCDTSGDAPACVALCGADETCPDGTCVRSAMHSAFVPLQGPFADGPSVTAACLQCHETEAMGFMETAHWKWLGPTPNLVGEEGSTDIGKRNLVNNFCIAVTSNEKRCSQCHAGYGYGDDSFDFTATGNIDCLVCHADPAAGYVKGAKTAGAPDPAVDLVLAAQSVGKTSRANCGSCHFTAGGGDNVKKGDMGSALRYPTRDIDVHMGAGMSCSSCHRGDDHTLLGQGVHVPVSEGRFECADCHSASPHASAMLDEHALDIACQTCHIPSFSRTQATKLDWNWATSGNRTVGTDGVEMTTLPDGTVVKAYDAMKGDFEWGKAVTPTYAWYDGRVARMTIYDAYSAGEGTEANPVALGNPLATISDSGAKIFPFKIMRGQQPAQPVSRLVLVPKLFGAGGFWAGIPAAGDYTAAAVHTLWTTALTSGARAAGQIGPAETIGESDWSWVYTTMYLGLNHEIAPVEQALGNACTDCHGGGDFDFEALGYLCDPMSNPVACGSRHLP